MNAKQYQRYEAAVAEFFDREGLANLSTVEDADGFDEPSFSWHPCDCCRRSQGGDRYKCNGFNPTTAEVQDGYDVCPDCLYYATYGRLDDETMWDVEHSQD